MPKSGSSFLSNAISNLPQFRRAQLIPAYDRREQELDEFCLRQADRFHYVAQHHVRYSAWTATMCRDYAIAPVVLVRNLLDVTVSLGDALRKDGAIWPFFFAEPRHAELSQADLDEMIVRLALPWYVNFYMGWRQAPDALLVNYEDLVDDPCAVVAKVLDFSGYVASDDEVSAAVNAATQGETRFNVGVVGRGAALRPDLADDVSRLLAFYPDAAGDPYVAGIRTGHAAQCPAVAAPASRTRSAATRFTKLGRWWRRLAPRLLFRGVAPIALIGVALIYWIVPRDLIPDGTQYGRVDDITVLLVCGALAGRLTLYRPRRPRARRSAGFGGRGFPAR